MTRSEAVSAAHGLNVEDLNYASSSERLGIFRLKKPKAWKRGLVVNAATFAGRWLMAARDGLRRPTWKSLTSGGVLAVVWSSNQLQSVTPVLDRLGGVDTLALHRSLKYPLFPEVEAYGASLRYLPRLLRSRAGARGYARYGFEYDLDKYLLTYGYFVTATKVLTALAPRLVLLANDHTMQTRVFEHAAHRMGITTAYMQHASVTGDFPPLAFDLAFLDGSDAAHKYDQPGSEGTRAFLTGVPKVDAHRASARERATVRRIGVCVNVLDPTTDVVRFVEDLRRLAPRVDVLLRPHPSDGRAWAEAVRGIELSDANSEPSFTFLDRVDAVITGPSNIVLEAALVGVRSVYVDFGRLGIDHYGFVERGLCVKADSAEQALALLDPAHGTAVDIEALKAYCATVGTAYDGRSAELVSRLIEEELTGGVDMRRWRQVPGLTHLTAYELAD
jgi:hypothetical protein